jgi:predicted transcriptional regulator
MWEAESKITDAEMEVMGALWASEEPMTLAQIKAALAESHGWSGDTTKTLLRRLCGKGAVEQEKRKVYYYRPLVAREQLGQYRTRRLIDKLYAGSAKAMVAALVEHRQLGPEDVDELRTFFQEMWEKEGN